MDESLADKLSFVDFGSICRGCNVNCCKRFYAVLLPEEERKFEGSSFIIDTRLGSVKAIGSRNNTPCPFLDEGGLCKIYRDRPFDCRLWPVMMYYDFSTDEKVVYLDLDCPAAKEGKIPKELIDRVIEVLRILPVNVEWLKRYTLAPWPNRLRELTRFR